MMKKKKTMFWGAIYVIALITVLVIVYVLPSVAGLFDRSYVAKYGNVEVKDETEGYIVRNETVYTAGKAGTVKHTVTEGELVKGNSKVVKISGEGASSSSDKYDSLLKKMKKEDALIVETPSIQVISSISWTDLNTLTQIIFLTCQRANLKSWESQKLMNYLTGK